MCMYDVHIHIFRLFGSVEVLCLFMMYIYMYFASSCLVVSKYESKCEYTYVFICVSQVLGACEGSELE